MILCTQHSIQYINGNGECTQILNKVELV